MTNPHNVDICVTCVSEKPPKLPLREELPSLGIEVVYNAKGVGAKASKQQSKKLVKEFREREKVKESKISGLFGGKKKKAKAEAERKRQEEQLRIPHALSYQSYEKRLQGEKNGSSSSGASWESDSTLQSSDAENKNNKTKSKWQRLGGNKQEPLSPTVNKDDMKPPAKIQFPTHTPEELAVKEAFNVFAQTGEDPLRGTEEESREGTKTKHSRPGSAVDSRDPTSSGHDPSTLTTKTGLENAQNKVKVFASGSVKDQLQDLASASNTRGSKSDSGSKIGSSKSPGSKSGSKSTLKTGSKLGSKSASKSGSKPSRQNNGVEADGAKTPSSHIASSGVDNSTLTTSQGMRNEESGPVTFLSTEDVRDELPHLKANNSPAAEERSKTTWEGGSLASKIASLVSQELSRVSKEETKEVPTGDLEEEALNGEHGQDPREDDTGTVPDDLPPLVMGELNSGTEGRSPTLSTSQDSVLGVSYAQHLHAYQASKVKVLEPPDESPLSEFYDLTQFSDDSGELVADSESLSKDLSTLSSKKDPPAKKPGHAGVQVYPSPAIQQQLPGLRLHIPEVDDGFGRIVLDLSSVYESETPQSEMVFESTSGTIDPPPRGVIHSPYKRDMQEDRLSEIRNMEERDDSYFREQMEIMESPTYRTTHSRQKQPNFDERQPVSPPQITRHGDVKSLFDDASSSDDVTKTSDDKKVIHSPRKSRSHDAEDVVDDELSELRVTKVSFSQDVEEHIFEEKDGYSDADRQEVYDTSDYHEAERQAALDAELLQERYNKLYEALQLPATERMGRNRREKAEPAAAYQQHFNSYVQEDPPSSGSSSLRGPVGQVGVGYGMEVEKSPEEKFLIAMATGTNLPDDFEMILEAEPSLASHKLGDIGMYPLHAACIRPFPDRFSGDQPCMVTHLVQDVVDRKELITALVTADPGKIRRLDEDGDLPVHLLARQFMEWEARWYQKVYEKARDDSEDEMESGAGITRLYQTMSSCVNLLLQPTSKNVELAKEPGSIGTLLPLHIASIFTVSYETLRALLETHPEAAAIPCELKDIRTFIPNGSIPLELHDRLSTDFPKWEIEAMKSEEEKAEINWTQATLDRSYGTKDGMRRSDLMFAFYPTVAPYRQDSARILGLEARILDEVSQWDDDDGYELSMAARKTCGSGSVPSRLPRPRRITTLTA